jgi:hypothetical protein
MRLINLLLCFLLSINLLAQNYKADFKKIAKFYSDADNLSMSVSVKSYSSSSDKTGKLLSNGNMIKSGTKYYSSFMNTEIIDDGKSVLIINHESKSADYFPENSIMSNIPKMDKDIDSLLKASDSIVYNGKKEGGLSYTCYGDKNDIINKYNMIIDEKDYHIVKIEFYYNQFNEFYEIDQYKMIVNYSNVSTTSKTDTKKINTSNYIVVKGNSYKLIGNNAGYKVSVSEKKKIVNKYIKG